MTVPELVVAIALLGVLVTIAGGLLGATAAGGRGVERASGESAAAGIARGAFRVLLSHARADEGRPVFEGDEIRARFQSFCADALGDLRRCDVAIEVRAAMRTGDVSLDRWGPDGPLIRLRGESLAYLPDDAEPRALPSWNATERVPAAIATVSGGDSTWFRVGRP